MSSREAEAFPYLVAYDIGDDGRRLHAAEVLLDHGGVRLQRSVFWVVLDDAKLVRVRSGLRAAVDERDDKVNLYRTCGNCPGIVGSTRSAMVPATTESADLWIV